jgi:DNA-binding transcriptional MerR regulator
MYRIGLFSKINKVTIKTLRYYDEVGLLKPAHVDMENGYRYYTSEQLPELHKLISLRQMGFSIDEISAILSGRDVAGVFEQRRC